MWVVSISAWISFWTPFCISTAQAGPRADLYKAAAAGPDMAATCSSAALAMDRLGRVMKEIGPEIPPLPTRFRTLFDPSLGASVVDTEGPVSLAAWKEAGAVEVTFATARPAEEVAKALAVASGGLAFPAPPGAMNGFGWTVTNEDGKELRVRVDAGIATARLGDVGTAGKPFPRELIEALPETPGCIAAVQVDSEETGAFAFAVHFPFAANTALSFAIMSPKLTALEGVAFHPRAPQPTLTPVAPAAVLVIGVGLDGINFSRFLHGDDLRMARRLQRWFPITSGTTIAVVSVKPTVTFGAALPLAKPLSATKVARRAERLFAESSGGAVHLDNTHFSTKMEETTIYCAGEVGRLLVASTPELLADLEAHQGRPWVEGATAELATRYPLVATSTVLPGEDGAMRTLDPPASLSLTLTPGMMRGEIYVPLTVDELARLVAELLAKETREP